MHNRCLHVVNFRNIKIATTVVFFHLQAGAQQDTALQPLTFLPDSSELITSSTETELPDTQALFTSLYVSNHSYQNFARRIPSSASGVYTTSSLKLKPLSTGWKVAIGAGYAALTYWCYKQADNDFREDSQEDLDGLPLIIARRASPLGEGKYHAMAFAATGVTALLLKDKKLQQTMVVWAGAALINDFATNSLKNTFQRHRPSTGKPANTFDWVNGSGVNRSFPSAHASNAFTVATVFATTYKDKRWVPPVAYGLATVVGASRVYNNAHWVSDVMAGAAIGFLSAKLSIMVNERITRSIKKKKG